MFAADRQTLAIATHQLRWHAKREWLRYFTSDSDGFMDSGRDCVDSCTALVEHLDGSMEILRWLDVYNERIKKPSKSEMAVPSKVREVSVG